MKEFLRTFAAVAAGFAAQTATAAHLQPQPLILPVDGPSKASDSGTPLDKITVTDSSGDAFNFVLKRSDDGGGALMAWHQSHSSHSSHRSHSSHYSSRY